METNTPTYWRHYYSAQGHLATHHLEDYSDNGSVGDVREQSTLPNKLNQNAHKIALDYVTELNNALCVLSKF